MAFNLTNFNLMLDSGIGDALPRIFSYRTSDASSDTQGTGYYAGVGAGARGLSNDRHVRVSDLILLSPTTNSTAPKVVLLAVSAATASSTLWNFSINVTASS